VAGKKEEGWREKKKDQKQVNTFGCEVQNQPNLRSVELCTWAPIVTMAPCLGGGRSAAWLHTHPEPLPSAAPGWGRATTAPRSSAACGPESVVEDSQQTTGWILSIILGGRVRHCGSSDGGPCVVVHHRL